MGTIFKDFDGAHRNLRYNMRIFKNTNLSPYTTLHVGGPAKFFTEVKNLSELIRAVDFAKKKKLEIFVLGGGSNVLISDRGINGLVIKIFFQGVSFKNNMIYAGAGESWDKVVAKAVACDLSGIENLSLIPGTVGGAVYQNIGAYGAELKDVLEYVDVFDIKSGRVKKFSNKECRFGYRASVFQKPAGMGYIILGACLNLSKRFRPNLKYPDLLRYFSSPVSGVNLQNIRKAITAIRKSKLVYPSPAVGSAGSFFKNPVIPITDSRRLTVSHPDLKINNLDNSFVKLSAAQLIERAGFKGKRFGKVGVSEKHALVLLTYPGAKAQDLKRLAKKVKMAVKKKFNINLEEEVRILS